MSTDPNFVPVLQRPWAIQRVQLFCVGKMSSFSLEKVSKYSRVCSVWDETLWELGTKDFILPQNFIRDSFFTSQQIAFGVSPNLQTLRNNGNKNTNGDRLPGFDQQEAVAAEAQEIMERTLLNDASIKYTKRIRKAFLFAGFDTKNLRNLPQLLRASTADIDHDSPLSTPVSTPTKHPHFEATYFGGDQIIVHQARDLLAIPRADKKFVEMHAFSHERRIPGYDTLSQDLATRLNNNNNNNFAQVGAVHSSPSISPDGRFVAYMFHTGPQRYVSVWMIGVARETKNNKSGRDDDDNDDDDEDGDDDDSYNSDDEFLEMVDAAIASKNRKNSKNNNNTKATSTQNTNNNSNNQSRRVKDDPNSASSISNNRASRCVGWLQLTPPPSTLPAWLPAAPHINDLSSVAFSKDSETLFFFDGMLQQIRCLRFNSRSGTFQLEEKPFDYSKIHQKFLLMTLPGPDGPVPNKIDLIQPCHVPQTLNLHKMATLGQDGIIGIWSIDTNFKNNSNNARTTSLLKPLLVLRPKNYNDNQVPAAVLHACFFTYTRRLGAIYSDMTMRIWDISAENSTAAPSSLSPPMSILARHGVEIDAPIRLTFATGVCCAALSQYDDSYYALHGGNSRNIFIVDIPTRTRKTALMNGNPLDALAFPPHSSQILIAASGARRAIQVWNIEQAAVVKTISTTDTFMGFAFGFPSAGTSGVMTCVSPRGSQHVFSISFFEKIASLNVSEALLRIIRIDGRKRQIDVEGISGDEFSLKF